MIKLKWLVLASIILTFFIYASPWRLPFSANSQAAAIQEISPRFSLSGDMEKAFVSRVIDGDTIVVAIGDTTATVRYIGMDAPETVHPKKPVECFGPEASARDKALAQGKTVWLEKDAGNRDVYGRLLRYVYLADGTMVNLELAEEGYARVLTISPNVKYEKLFTAAVAAAQNADRGLWSTCAYFGQPAALNVERF